MFKMGNTRCRLVQRPMSGIIREQHIKVPRLGIYQVKVLGVLDGLRFYGRISCGHIFDDGWGDGFQKSV